MTASAQRIAPPTADNDWTQAQERAVCGILLGNTEPWPDDLSESRSERFLEHAAYHGIMPLLHRALRRNPASRQWPGLLSETLERNAKEALTLDLIRTRELVRTLAALEENGVGPLLMKGAPLAHTLYEDSSLRPRGDTDILVAGCDRISTAQTLAQLGYRQANAISGQLVSYQSSSTLLDDFGVAHDLDVHWRISNHQGFARALTYHELSESSEPVAALGEPARGLSLVHGLLLACMHLASHVNVPCYTNRGPRYGGHRLIWLYDIHLLVNTLARHELDGFVDSARRKEVTRVCREALRRTYDCFPTPATGETLNRLSEGRQEATALYLRRSRVAQVAGDLGSLSSTGDRVRLLAEHLLPPAEYMLHKYRVSNASWLPVLYLRRLMGPLCRFAGAAYARVQAFVFDRFKCDKPSPRHARAGEAAQAIRDPGG